MGTRNASCVVMQVLEKDTSFFPCTDKKKRFKFLYDCISMTSVKLWIFLSWSRCGLVLFKSVILPSDPCKSVFQKTAKRKREKRLGEKCFHLLWNKKGLVNGARRPPLRCNCLGRYGLKSPCEVPACRSKNPTPCVCVLVSDTAVMDLVKGLQANQTDPVVSQHY